MKAITGILEEVNLPLDNVICLGSDGPNVKIAVQQTIDELSKELGGDRFLAVGACNLMAKQTRAMFQATVNHMRKKFPLENTLP